MSLLMHKNELIRTADMWEGEQSLTELWYVQHPSEQTETVECVTIAKPESQQGQRL